MTYKYLFIFVEGKDDQEFFERIIKPELSTRYNHINIQQWARYTKEKLNSFIKNIKLTPTQDYIFITDKDNASCISSKKEYISKAYNELNKEKIIVSIEEIEGWYLSGLNDEGITALKIDRNLLKKDHFKPYKITKECFNELQKPYFDFRIDFMQKILHLFDFETAKQNNASFKYFVDKYIA